MYVVTSYTADLTVDSFGFSFEAQFADLDSVTQKTTPVDLTGATVDFLFKRPDGTVTLVVATVTDQKAGKATYPILDGFLDLVGGWEWQAKVATSTGVWWSDKKQIVVTDHLRTT